MMDVVVQVAAAAVDVTNFITASDASKEAFKTATLLKTLSVNSLITGENGVGKESLATYILPDAPLLDASNFDELLIAIDSSSEIIITNLENSPNFNTIVNSIKSSGVRVIATAKSTFYNEHIDDLFSIKFEIPPLSQRLEDVEFLIEKFKNEAHILFGSNKEINFNSFNPDLSENANSLKRQVMVRSLLSDINDIELMDIMQNYLVDKMGSSGDYRKFLYLYEAPLINAGLEKFKSQLQLADKLGLNRNTLRKKIADNKEYLN